MTTPVTIQTATIQNARNDGLRLNLTIRQC
jgi:hypothetical protein